MERVKIIVSGKVQGVFFRDNVCKSASHLGLKSYVKNIENGLVEIIVEGELEKINMLVKYLKSSPGESDVENVDLNFSHFIGEFSRFEIRY